MEAKREESFELQEEMSRWLFNCDHHFFDEISMKMIVTTKEAFELKYKSGKTMFAQEVVCAAVLLHPRPIFILSAPAVAFNAPGFCQIQSQ